MAQNLRNILDIQDLWLYVIDYESFRLRYLNEKTHLIAPGSEAGMKCYEAFFHRDKPCDLCPARMMKEGSREPVEIYNPLFHVWTLADTACIRWENKKGILLTCRDITRYKDE